jgi:prevent-host-death family protein
MDNVSIRELRNHGGAVVERVEHAEAICITRDGRPVAELPPLEHAHPTLRALFARFRGLALIDAAALRRDIDDVLDSSL